MGKQKLEKDTILHGMGRLGSHRAQLLLAAPKNQDRGCPGSCPISTSLTGGQDALRNLCRLHWLAYLTIPLVGTLSQQCLCLIKSGNIFTLSTPIPFPLQHLSFSFNTQFSSSCPRNSPKCQTYRPKSFLILSKKQTKIPNSPVKIPQKPFGNFPHRHFALTNPQHSLLKLPMPSSAQA